MKKYVLLGVAVVGLSACGGGENSTVVQSKQNAFYSLDFYGGNKVNVKRYSIENGMLDVQSSLSFDKAYFSEANQYYFTAQGILALSGSPSSQNFTWGQQAVFNQIANQAILEFAPNHVSRNASLKIKYQLQKIDLTGWNFTAFSQNQFEYSRYKLTGDLKNFGSAENQILHAILFASYSDLFPSGSACWKIVEQHSNQDYIEFDQTQTSSTVIDANTPLVNQGVWGGTAWQVVNGNIWNTFFKIGSQQYLGTYISKDTVLPEITGNLQCDYLNETAVKALLTRYKPLKDWKSVG